MSEADPARPLGAAKLGAGELALRVVSALLLAPVAIGVAWLGGWLFAAFWGVAALLVFWEWTSLVSSEDRRAVLIAGGASIVLAVALAAASGNAAEGIHDVRLLGAITVLAMGVLAVAALSPRPRSCSRSERISTRLTSRWCFSSLCSRPAHLAAASSASCFSFSKRSALRRMVLASLAALSALV